MDSKMHNELSRKSIHIASTIIPLAYYFLPKFWMLLLLIPATLLIVIIDFVRIESFHVGKLFFRFFSRMLRRHEMTTLTGASYVMVSALICIAFLDKFVAIAALLFLTVGDTFAAIVGISIGRIRIGFGKSLEGSLAFFVSSVIAAKYATSGSFLTLSGELNWEIILIGAFLATILEILPLPLDDNLRISVISGIVMQALKSLFF